MLVVVVVVVVVNDIVVNAAVDVVVIITVPPLPFVCSIFEIVDLSGVFDETLNCLYLFSIFCAVCGIIIWWQCWLEMMALDLCHVVFDGVVLVYIFHFPVSCCLFLFMRSVN